MLLAAAVEPLFWGQGSAGKMVLNLTVPGCLPSAWVTDSVSLQGQCAVFGMEGFNRLECTPVEAECKHDRIM